VYWVIMAAPLRAQISPGPLASAHASLEGPTQCTQCHGNRRDAMGPQCLACHKDIGWLGERGRGLHGSAEVKATPCASCHPDHAGKDFKMVKWPEGSPEKFDHRRAGWPLRQKHAAVECQDCHVAKFLVSPPANLSARKTGVGYAGLDTTCTSCHEDVHRAALGATCTRCHDLASWTVTPGFDHDTTAYPLTDKHAEVKCDKCHLDPRLAPRSDGKGHLVPVYKPVPFEGCASCHADPHNGALGPKCADCHTTAGFRVIDKNRFDHSRTRYPLAGRHAVVPCAGCHKDFSTAALKKPAFATCASCHADAHKGTASLAGKPVDCASCHTVNGYVPSTYTVADHAAARYPLEGKHAAVKCGACHTRSTVGTAVAQYGSAKVVMRPAFAKCTDCHADDHGGQLKARADQGQCSACHRVAGWTPSTFDSAAHATLKLPLDGRHRQVECAACHGLSRTGLPPMSRAVALGKANFLFAVPETDCVACHADPHQGRFEAGGARPQSGGCPTCHSTRMFRPSTTTVSVHALFGFPLEGAHRATACSACHQELARAPAAQKQSSLVLGGGRFGTLRFEEKHDCVDCHKTPHGTQFDARTGGCAACHSEDAFQPAGKFDHNRDASFSLKGAHEKVPCAQCHAPDPKSATPSVVRYRPLSGSCESCHGKESK
jgi:hypothetical protein